jgi:hypothetical protein
MATALKSKDMSSNKNKAAQVSAAKTVATKVYCTLCTRTVEANVTIAVNSIGKRRLAVVPGQKCQHCGGALDAAYVLSNLS